MNDNKFYFINKLASHTSAGGRYSVIYQVFIQRDFDNHQTYHVNSPYASLSGLSDALTLAGFVRLQPDSQSIVLKSLKGLDFISDYDFKDLLKKEYSLNW